MESPDTSQQDTKSENLGDVIAETFDAMESGEESNEEVEVSAEVHEEEHSEDVEQEEAPEVEASEEQHEELQEEIEDAADSDYTEPAPERWSDEIKDVYNSLPPPARKAMLDGIYKPMQKQYTQTTQELAAMRNELSPMLDVVKQYQGDFDRMGVSPVEALRTQMAWASHLQKVGAEQGMQDMQKAYGVGTTSKAVDNVYLTPTERAMKEQLNTLQKQVQGQQHDQQQTQQQQEQQRVDGFKNEVQQNLHAFINEKTESGTPKHPHMDKVASKIAGIIRGGLVSKADEYGQQIPIRDQLAQAYTMACNLDPSIRTPISDTRQAKRAKTAQKVSVVTKHPAGQSDVEELDMGSFIERTYDQLAGG